MSVPILFKLDSCGALFELIWKENKSFWKSIVRNAAVYLKVCIYHI